MHTDKRAHDWSATVSVAWPRQARTIARRSGSLPSVAIRIHLWLLLTLACCTPGWAQSPVRDYRRSHERQIIDEFTRLLAIPNIASDKENIRRSAQYIVGTPKQMLHKFEQQLTNQNWTTAQEGVDVKLVPGPDVLPPGAEA